MFEQLFLTVVPPKSPNWLFLELSEPGAGAYISTSDSALAMAKSSPHINHHCDEHVNDVPWAGHTSRPGATEIQEIQPRDHV